MNRSHLKQTIERHTGRESISAHQGIPKQATSHSTSLSGIGKPKNNGGRALIELALIGLYCFMLICIYITPNVNGSSLGESVVVPKEPQNRPYILSDGRVYAYA